MSVITDRADEMIDDHTAIVRRDAEALDRALTVLIKAYGEEPDADVPEDEPLRLEIFNGEAVLSVFVIDVGDEHDDTEVSTNVEVFIQVWHTGRSNQGNRSIVADVKRILKVADVRVLS